MIWYRIGVTCVVLIVIAVATAISLALQALVFAIVPHAPSWAVFVLAFLFGGGFPSYVWGFANILVVWLKSDLEYKMERYSASLRKR